MWKNLVRLSNCIYSKNNGFHLKLSSRDPEKIKFTHIRGCSTTGPKKEEEKYFMMYRLNEIRFLSSFCKLKTPLFGGSVLASPILAACEFANVFDTYTTITFMTMACCMVGGLSLYSMAFENTIGIIKHNENQDKIMVSYVDFWGQRKDEVIAVENWIPLCDLPKRFTDTLYITVEYNNSNSKRKLYLRESYIKDPKSFKKLLGYF